VSTCSFHATKLFHTGEGGAMFCKDIELFKKLFYSHNFGHKNNLEFHGLGINGKISELQAAMGLAVLPHMEVIVNERKKVVNFYNLNLNFRSIKKIKIRENCDWNYSYYPVVFSSEATLLRIEAALNKENIFPRRYFYPSLNTIEYCKGEAMPIAESISQSILCLPLYVGLKTVELENICRLINKHL
jgi:dTDP-4-amino-4,6-dideoxygalactose transaminase